MTTHDDDKGVSDGRPGGGGDDVPVPPRRPQNRLYAHVHTFEVICPRCGTYYRKGPRGRVAAEKVRTGGYQVDTGLYTCIRPGCGYRAYVGLVLWPLKAGVGGRVSRPPDHVLTPGEAVARRTARSYEAAGRLGGRGERVTNVVCTCAGEGAVDPSCCVHQAPGPLTHPPDTRRRHWTEP